MDICSEPYRRPAAWRAADLTRDTRWLYNLTASDINELDQALSEVKGRGIGVPEIATKDFPLNRLAEKLAAAWKGGVKSASTSEPYQEGQLRSFTIKNMDAAGKKIELTPA